MSDPSHNVHQDLLPHVHLISAFRYPLMSRVELNDVTKWLLQAPSIARDKAPFYWTYLDCPADSTIFLMWQPTARRGNEFSSDGYYWASPEVMLTQPVGNGLVLEIFFQKCGWRAGEQFTMHSRRRFRLAHARDAQVANLPQIDPNLWIVHYGPSEKQDRFPTGSFGVPPQIQSIMNNRQHLFQLGQIVRKEFMLSDRVNWPQIPFPQRGQSIYVPPMHQQPMNPRTAYLGGPGAAGQPQSKRRGQQAQPGHPMGAAYPSAEGALDDDEDVHRGDMFDHLSPREMSMHRYQQNHEWMEEILSSPYRIGQLEVSDLGLGKKGALASLTEGIFEAQSGDVLERLPKKPYAGRLGAGLADEFRKRAEEKIAATQAEIQRMKAQHEKRMAEFKSNTAIRDAEAELRAATNGVGNEPWRLEGRLEDVEGEETVKKTSRSIEQITADVEKLLGSKVVTVPEVSRVQDGGYQQQAPEPELVQPPPQQLVPEPIGAVGLSRQPSHNGSQASGVLIGDSDIDMGGTAAGLLDQMHSGFSSTSTPINSFPTPQPSGLSGMASNVGTPANQSHIPSPHPAPTSQPAPSAGSDVKMEDAKQPTTAPDQGTGSGEWVVVPPGGGAPVPPAPATTTAAASTNIATTAAGGGIIPPSKPASAAPTPDMGFGASPDNDQNDFSSLGDLDTAGDALANYDPPSVDNRDLDMDDIVVEDSAFGEAFGDGQGAEH
ncbi:hypothetical protein B0T21DRAFT_350224 [Apiosordaria backusii]|uniref:DUF1750-domain-containing protein n=1 Tax=Apiosordaria backusii TaxID=314023 RepID=A0AA40B7Z0_9PEZI|nr:hypothetical protein B0T21DRAFT_350224 [Apiosordaria backusii]